jgi:hypothetical protein
MRAADNTGPFACWTIVRAIHERPLRPRGTVAFATTHAPGEGTARCAPRWPWFLMVPVTAVVTLPTTTGATTNVGRAAPNP